MGSINPFFVYLQKITLCTLKMDNDVMVKCLTINKLHLLHKLICIAII